MIKEFKEVFSNDYIKIGRHRIRPFSILWWIIRVEQGICGIAGLYLLYCCLWALLI